MSSLASPGTDAGTIGSAGTVANHFYCHMMSPFRDPNLKRSTHGDSLFSLDGVRGLAVLVVVLSQANMLGMGGQGSIGVLLFFVLSGFVLTLPFAIQPKRIFSAQEI